MSSTVSTPPLGSAPGSDEIDPGVSVAGEEDPGASIDMASRDAAEVRMGSDQPAGTVAGAPAVGAGEPMKPGDQAPEGTPGTGEDVCPDCGGSGRQGGKPCPTCEGTGKVNVGIGGA